MLSPVAHLSVSDFSRANRPGVVWLLACLVLAQAIAASVLVTLGPAHTHEPTSRPLVLEDVRRAPSRLMHRPVHVLAAFGHFHSSGSPERHYHQRDDGRVVLLDEGSLQLADDNDAAASPALALVALLASPARWLAPAGRSTPAWPAAWPSITNDPEPLERPPRSC
jgi:hypothetical protein